jgi:hypothetical protein
MSDNMNRDTKDERGAFEKWASQYTKIPERYDDIPAWLAWQAARATAEPVATTAVALPIPKDFCEFGGKTAFAWKALDASDHDPWYVVLPNTAALKLGYHSDDSVDKAHAEFIAAAINKALHAAEPVAQEPAATLHDDGYWTWKKGKAMPASNYAGWRMDVYAAPQPNPGAGVAKPNRLFADDIEITPKRIAEGIAEGDLTIDEAADWIEKLFAHRQGSAQPSAPAVGLTDEEICVLASDYENWSKECGVDVRNFDALGFARALLAAAPTPVADSGEDVPQRMPGEKFGDWAARTYATQDAAAPVSVNALAARLSGAAGLLAVHGHKDSSAAVLEALDALSADSKRG